MHWPSLLSDGPFAVNPKSDSLQSLTNLNADNLTSGGTVYWGANTRVLLILFLSISSSTSVLRAF
jgi:hypothetical protein